MMGDAFGPRPCASRRANLRCLALSAAVAIAGCDHSPRFASGYCSNIRTGQSGPAEYDRALGGRWHGKDANGVDFQVDGGNSAQWKCERLGVDNDVPVNGVAAQ